MTYSVVHSVPTELDLDRVVHYIAIRLENPNAAADLLRPYEEKLSVLRETPKLYGLSRLERLARMGYRRFDFGNYFALYTVDDAARTVFITRIFYRKQDYENIDFARSVR